MVLVNGQLDPTAGQRLVTVLDVLNPPDPKNTLNRTGFDEDS